MRKVGENAIKAHFDRLAKIGNLGGSLRAGFTRAGWSKEESEAIEYIRGEAEKAGLETRYDGIGNLYCRAPGNQKEIVMTGSHLDTVVEGGNYDGAAGVVAGLEAIKAAMGEGLKKGLELVVWRGEESATYELAYKGSKGAFGNKFSADVLSRAYEGKALEQAIREQGFDPGYFREGKPTLPQDYVDSISGYIELHIEQGNRLEQDRKDIGIVTSIRGPGRYRVIVAGEFGHSGATPMGTGYRKDANLAISYMQVRLDEFADKALREGKDLVQTVGIVNADKGINNSGAEIYKSALTKVCGYGYFTLEIRSDNKAFREKYVKGALALLKGVAKEKNVEVKFEKIGEDAPLEKLGKKIQDSIEQACEETKISYEKMPSGAGHDAAVIAKQKKSGGKTIPAGMIFIPCKAGKSHAKEEFATNAAITKGANVLAFTLLKLAS